MMASRACKQSVMSRAGFTDLTLFYSGGSFTWCQCELSQCPRTTGLSQRESLLGAGVWIFCRETRADRKTKGNTQKQRENSHFLSSASTKESTMNLLQNFCYYKLDFPLKNFPISLSW